MADAALQIKVGMQDVDPAAQSLERLDKAASRAEKSTDRLAPSATRAANANRALQQRVDSANRSMETMVRTATRLGVALLSAFSTRAILGMADSWERMKKQVGVAIRDMDNAGAAMDRMAQIARSSYSSMQQTVQTFTDAVPVFRNMGKSADEAADYVESLNLMLVAGYVEGQRAESVQWALNKAMAVGKLTTMGLETVLANSAEVSQALADELGVTTNQLRKMASEGKITGDVISRAIIGRLEETRDVVSKMPYTLGGAMQTLRTELQIFVGMVNQATTTTASLAQVIVLVAHNIGRIAAIAATFAAFMAAQWVVSMLRATRAMYSLNAALALFRTALIRTGIGAVIVLVGELIYQFLRLVEATGGVGAAFVKLGELAKLVWQGIKDSAAALPVALKAVWNAIKADFFGMLASIVQAWEEALGSMALGARRMGWEDIADRIAGAAQDAGRAWDVLEKKQREAANAAKAGLAEAGTIVKDAFDPAIQKLAELNKLSSDLGGSLGSGGSVANAIDEFGSKGKGATDKFRDGVKSLAAELEHLKQTLHFGDLAADIFSKQQEMGVDPLSQQGQIIDGLMREIDATQMLIDAKEKLNQATERGAEAMATLFTDALTGAKSLKDAFIALIAEIARMQLMKGFTSLFGGAGSFIGGLLSPNAMGGVYASPGLSAYSGQIVSQPTVFPFAKGVGLMGEAGPEAILPLKRGSDGRLGVQADNRNAQPGGEVEVRVYMDEGGNWKAEAARIAGKVSVQVVSDHARRQSDRRYQTEGQ